MRVGVACVLLVVSLGGCVRDVVYAGTRAYDARVATLAVTPAEARRIAEGTGHDLGATRGLPVALVRDAYLFNPPYKMAQLRLQGVYVDGHTGAAEYRYSEVRLTPGFSLAAYPQNMPGRLPENAYTRTETLGAAKAMGR